ncbi:MAG: helix-turn-helix domain-containing protein [Halapricum sp.]
MSLLPSKPDTSSADAEPRVIGVDSDDADDVISALSSETARELLAELHEDPAPPSELADRVDTSLQNAQYHLEKLQSAGAVSVVDTAYSAKGREMDVYAPADKPLIIFAGDEEETTGLRAALSRLIGGLGVLGLGSFVVQQLYGDATEGGTTTGSGPGPGVGPATTTEGTAGPATTPTVEETTEGVDVFVNNSNGTYETTLGSTENVTDVGREATATPEATTETATTIATNTTETVTSTVANATETAPVLAGVEPGLLFFAGGLLILSLWLGVWYVRNR